MKFLEKVLRSKKLIKRKIGLILILSILLFIFFIFNIKLWNLYQDAVGNYKLACVYVPSLAQQKNSTELGLDEIEQNTGHRILGIYDSSTKQIKVFVNDSRVLKVLKHEECHKEQDLEGRLHSCENKIRFILNEFECLIMEYF